MKLVKNSRYEIATFWRDSISWYLLRENGRVCCYHGPSKTSEVGGSGGSEKPDPTGRSELEYVIWPAWNVLDGGLLVGISFHFTLSLNSEASKESRDWPWSRFRNSCSYRTMAFQLWTISRY